MTGQVRAGEAPDVRGTATADDVAPVDGAGLDPAALDAAADDATADHATADHVTADDVTTDHATLVDPVEVDPAADEVAAASSWSRLLPPGRRPAAAAVLAVVAVLAVGVPFALSTSPGVSVAAPIEVERLRVPVEPLPPLPVPASPPAEPVRIAGPGTPAGDSRIVDLTIAGEPRAYFLLPALNLPPDRPSSLLVVLHQDVGSAREMSVGLGLDDLRKKGVTLAYPSGIGGSWNAGGCCGVALSRGVDDVAFVNAVLDDVGRHTPIDPARRALLGYSGGGMLAYRLLCGDHPPLIAAVEVNGSLEHTCDGPLELPDLLAVHGEKDGSIDLTTSHYVNHLRMSPRSVTSTLATVSSRAGCGPRSTSTVNGIGVWTSPDCRGGTTVEAHIVPDAGHGWADVGGAARASVFLLPRLAKG